MNKNKSTLKAIIVLTVITIIGGLFIGSLKLLENEVLDIRGVVFLYTAVIFSTMIGLTVYVERSMNRHRIPEEETK